MSLSHRDICVSAAKWLLGQSGIQLVSWELGLDVGNVDVIGLTTKTRQVKNPKIVVMEIKRTRSDLLQDLKRKKMHGYEARATHCYLALAQEAALTPTQLKQLDDPKHIENFKDAILEDLAAKGLPNHWGVLVALPWNGEIYWRCLRSSRRTKTRITTGTLATITKKIALSFMYRILSPNSPMTELS